MNEKIKELRNFLGLSQESFGDKLGVGKTAISKLENGDRRLTNQMAKSICREFNVNYFWLIDGEGDMFTDFPRTIIDELASLYEMSDYEILMITKYLSLSKQERNATQSILKKIFSID